MSNGLKNMYGVLTLDVSLDIPKDVSVEKMQEYYGDESIKEIGIYFTDMSGFGYDLKIHDFHVKWEEDDLDEKY